MAYKFQQGQFNASGTVAVVDDIDTQNGSILADNIAGTTLNLEAASLKTMTVAGALSLSDVSASTGVVIRGTGNSGAEQFMINEKSTADGVNMQFGSGSATTQCVFKQTDTGDELYGVELSTSSGVKFKANYTTGEGKVSGSGNFQFGDALTVAGAVTITGNLTVTGASTKLNATAISVGANSVKIAADHANDSDIQASTIEFSTSANKLKAMYNAVSHNHGEADGLSVKRIKFIDTDASDLALLVAPKFFGSAANLTGLTTSTINYNVDERASGDQNIVEGFNYYEGSAAITLTLPTINSDNDGKIYIVKHFNSTLAAGGITIAVHSSNAIDANANGDSVKINSPFGSVTFVASGTKYLIV